MNLLFFEPARAFEQTPTLRTVDALEAKNLQKYYARNNVRATTINAGRAANAPPLRS
jgi:hypothetical protein